MKVGPVGGALIGGGAAVVPQVLGRFYPAAWPGAAQVYSYKGLVGLAFSAAAAGVLYWQKQKDAALVALATGALASLTPGIDEVRMLTAAPAGPAAAARTTAGFGIAIAEQRGAFGAPPTIELFGQPEDIQLFGHANTQSHSSFQPSAFGGQSF